MSVGEEIKKKMELFPEINWSEIARVAIVKRILILEEMRKILSKSEMSDEDAIKLGREVNRNVAKRYFGIVKGKKISGQEFKNLVRKGK